MPSRMQVALSSAPSRPEVKEGVLRAIGSMATRGVHARLAEAFAERGGVRLALEAVGGVDAARRIEAGERFDLVLLAQDALERLAADGHVQADSVTPLMRSRTAVAVAEGAPLPDLSTMTALRAALRAALSIGHSTGPSGRAFRARLAEWGLLEALGARLVEAPPGTPVARLIAEGRVALGVQQLSEIVGEPGVRLAGLLPPGAEIDTVFAGAVGAGTAAADAARDYLRFARSAAAAPIIEAAGMTPIPEGNEDTPT